MYWFGTTDDEEPAPIIGDRKTSVTVLARLKWTRETPTKPGKYHVWSPFQGLDEVRILHDGSLLWYPEMWVEINGGRYRLEHKYQDPLNLTLEFGFTHWLGPLPEPEAPMEN